jgi:Pyridoxamine 5'-phosphate oxidase
MAVAVRPQQVREFSSERASHVTSAEVWRELDRASFAVVGYVTPSGESRSTGVVFKTSGGRLFTAVAPDSWKARHIAASPKVSVTVPVRRGAVLTLAFPIPPATISFHGRAVVHAPGSLDLAAISPELASLVPEGRRHEATVIELVPEGRFLTYGLGVALTDMARPELAHAVVPVEREHGARSQARVGPGAAVYALMAGALAAAVAGIWFLPAAVAAVLAGIAAVVLGSRGALKHERARIAILAVSGFIALTTIPGGGGLLRGTIPIPTSWLAGTPFPDYAIPGLALLVICGGAASVAWLSAFVRRRRALVASGVAGVVMAGFEVVEIVSVDRNLHGSDLGLALGMQLAWLVAGLALAFLAAKVWRAPGPG